MWIAATAGVVLLGACSGVPKEATSQPSPTPLTSADRRRMACDTIKSARQDYQRALGPVDAVLHDPRSTPAQVHEQADKLLAALKTLSSDLSVAAGKDLTIAVATLDWSSFVDDARFAIQQAGDDRTKIEFAIHHEVLAKVERRVLDLCEG